MVNKVYICHTVYHVYVSMLKEYNSRDESDLYLVDTILNADELVQGISQTGIFNKIVVISREKVFGKKIRTFLGNYINCYVYFDKICVCLKELTNYKDIYIFNDYTEVGAFLSRARIAYHLLEDGLDVFKQFDVYEEIGHGYLIKKILNVCFKIPYSVGMTQECMDIEVNDAENLKTTLNKKILVQNRNMLAERLDDSYKEKIFRAFGAEPLTVKTESVLILTQVLSEVLIVKNDLEQLEFYEKIIKQYSKQHSIYIKPHPRDMVDYSCFERKYGVVVLNKKVPLEVYAYLPDVHFKYAITYSSTAVNGNNIAEQIIRLDSKAIIEKEE